MKRWMRVVFATGAIVAAGAATAVSVQVPEAQAWDPYCVDDCQTAYNDCMDACTSPLWCAACERRLNLCASHCEDEPEPW